MENTKEKDFDEATLILFEDQYWVVYLHQEQMNNLGRCSIISRREKISDLLGLMEVERTELFKVTAVRLKAAIEQVCWPDDWHYLFTSNVDRQLVMHVIPRYAETREFRGNKFNDMRWGRMPNLSLPIKTEPHVLYGLKEALIKALANPTT